MRQVGDEMKENPPTHARKHEMRSGIDAESFRAHEKGGTFEKVQHRRLTKSRNHVVTDM